MLNVAVLMGRLVANPELRHTSSDVAVTSFTIAVNRSYVKPGMERQTDFIDIVAWRHTAEFVCKYFSKGQLIAVEGTIQTRNYEDKEGRKRKAVEVVASGVHFAEPKRSPSHGSGAYISDDDAPPENFSKQAEEDTNTTYSNGIPSDFEEVVSDDDLPF